MLTYDGRDGPGYSYGIGPSHDAEFADVGEEVDAAFEDVLLELGEIPVTRSHSVVTAPPDESRVGHDVLLTPFFLLHVHLVLCFNTSKQQSSLPSLPYLTFSTRQFQC